MREIKFRAWDGGKFYEASCIDLLGGYPSVDCCCMSEDLIFQQFTGLLDKDGKEIYEGDILFSDYDEYEVIFQSGMFGVRLEDDIVSPLYEYLDGFVIGNIFEK